MSFPRHTAALVRSGPTLARFAAPPSPAQVSAMPAEILFPSDLSTVVKTALTDRWRISSFNLGPDCRHEVSSGTSIAGGRPGQQRITATARPNPRGRMRAHEHPPVCRAKRKKSQPVPTGSRSTAQMQLRPAQSNNKALSFRGEHREAPAQSANRSL
jgi:hypothetical protein